MSAEGGLTGVSLAAGARAAAAAAEDEEEEEGAPSRGGGIGAVLAVPPGAIRPGGSLALRRVEAQEMDAIDDDDPDRADYSATELLGIAAFVVITSLFARLWLG